MLLNLFDGHPELCVFPHDLYVLYAYFPVYEGGDYSLDVRKKRVDAVLFREWEQLPELAHQMDIASFRTAFFERMESSLWTTRDVLRQLLVAYRSFVGLRAQRCKGTVAKETSIEIYANQLFEWFPNAKFVHVIRDPRDNYGALRAGVNQRYRHFGDDTNTILHSLLERCGLGLKMADINLSRHGLDKYTIVRFEDLLETPVETMRGICDFLGIAYDRCMTVPTVLGHPTQGNSYEHIDFSKISARNVGRWPERILPDEAMVIEFHLSELMVRFGYEPAFTRPEQASAAAEFYKWSNYKYHFFDRYQEPDAQRA